jgi:hypothetical protein
MDILAPPDLRIVLHVFLSISIVTIAEYSSMCIKTIKKILFDFERRTILLSPHSDSLKIHVVVLDE